MKRFLLSLCLLAAVGVAYVSQAQTSIRSMQVQTGVDATKWITLSSNATQILEGGTDEDADYDDVTSSILNIGMSVYFYGDTYTQFSVNSNGILHLGATEVGTYYMSQLTPYQISFALPKVVALTCDQSLGTNGYIKSELTGTAPNRVFVCEFFLTETSSSDEAASNKWQVQYHEADSSWWFVYNSVPSSLSAYQIGMANSEDDLLVINATTHQATYQTTTATNSVWPGAYRYYTFVPTTCPAVRNLHAEALSTDSIRVSWHPGGSETQWVVRDGALETTVSDTVLYFSGLNSNTTYNYYVAPYCSMGDTGAFGIATAQTPCSVRSLPYNENFESITTSTASATGAVPSCWRLVQYDTVIPLASYVPTIYYSSNSSYSNGRYCLRLLARCIYALPPFNVDSLNNVGMSFVTRKGNSTALAVGVMSDLNDVSTYFGIDTIINPNTTDKVTHLVSFTSAPRNAKYIVFRNIPLPGATDVSIQSTHYIDDIEVYSNSCPMVSNLTATALSSDSVRLSWTAGGSEYEWRVSYNNIDTIVSSNSVVLDGLSGATTYTFSVYSICGADTGRAVNVSILTPCGALIPPTVINFDNSTTSTTAATGVLPLCWTRVHQDVAATGANLPSIYYGSTYATSGNYSMRMYYRGMIAMPPIATNDLSKIELSFKMRTANVNYGVEVGTIDNLNDWNSWVLLGLFKNANTSSFTTHSLSLTDAPNSARYIVFRNMGGTNASYSTVYIDDISISQAECKQPPHLYAFSPTKDSLIVRWNMDEGFEWLVTHGSTTVSTYDSTIAFANLAAGSTQTVSVRAICSANDTSEARTITYVMPQCNPLPLPYVQNFDTSTTSTSASTGVVPTCWRQGYQDISTTSANYKPQVYYSSTYANSGLYCLRMYYRGIAVLPQFATDSMRHLAMELSVRQTAAATQLAVGVMNNPNDPATFIPIDTLNCTVTNAHQNFTVFFANAPEHARYIAFRNFGGSYSYAACYIDNIRVYSQSCPVVRNVVASAVSYDSILLTWQPGSTETEWIISGDSISSLVVNDTFAYVSGLQGSTEYTFRIQGVCSMTDTANWVQTSCRTICGPISIPFTENFESYTTVTSAATGVDVPCWDVVHQDVANWNNTYRPQIYRSTSFATSGQYLLRLYYRCLYVMPPLDVDSLNDVEIQFSLRQTSSSSLLSVGTMSNPSDPSTYVPTDTINVPVTDQTLLQTVYFGNAPSNARYIAFRNLNDATTSSSSSINYIDDIHVYRTTCPRPTNFVVSAVSTDSLSLSWRPGNSESSWLVSGDSIAPFVANDTSVYIGGLRANTYYTFSVRAICNAGDSSTAVTASGKTFCSPFTTLPYVENFDNVVNVLPDCWTGHSTYNSTFPNVNNSYYSGNSGRALDIGVQDNGYQLYTMVSLPEFTTPVNQLQASFELNYPYEGESGIMIVGVCTVPSDISTFYPLDTISTPDTTWTSYTVLLDGYQGTGKYISFVAKATNGWGELYMDNLRVELIPPCPRVANLHGVSVSDVSLTVDWTDRVTPAQWEVAVVRSGLPLAQASSSFFTSHPVTLTGLTAGSEYDIYVRPICSATEQGDWVSTTIYTAYCASEHTGSTYAANSARVSNEIYTPMPSLYYNYSLIQTILDSAEVADLNEISAMKFYTDSDSGGTYLNNCRIYIGHTTKTQFASSTDWCQVNSGLKLVYTGSLNFNRGGQHYVVFDSSFIWNGHSNIVVMIDRDHGSYIPDDYPENFPAYSCTGYKTLVYMSDNASNNPDPTNITVAGDLYNYRGKLDLVGCDACIAPSLLPASNVDYQSATIAWQQNTGIFEVSYKQISDASWSNEIRLVDVATYSLSNLAPSTEYMYRVRRVCDTVENVVSTWQEGSFTTDSLPCFAPADLTVTESTLTTASFSWTNIANSNQWQIHIFDATFDSIYTVSTNPVLITGLTPAMTYNAAVRSICGGGLVESDYSDTISFSTQECAVPTNLNIDTVGNEMATISWIGSASSYELQYGDINFPTGSGTTVNVQGNQYTITGLERGSSYHVIVRSICEDGIMSVYSDRLQINTTDVSIDKVNAANLTIYPNPSNSSAAISVSGLVGQFNLTVVDLNGRQIHTETLMCDGNCATTIQVSHLAAGTYFVKLDGLDVNVVRKLVVK